MKTIDEKYEELSIFKRDLFLFKADNRKLMLRAEAMNRMVTSHVLKLAGDELQKAINYCDAQLNNLRGRE